MERDPFEEYYRQLEPSKREKGNAWNTAIGLQAVDGLKTSDYLKDTAIRNIEGEISFEEAQELLNTYYEHKPEKDDNRTEEADKVSARIAAILSENAFTFTPNQYLSIHKRLFSGIYEHAGTIRDYNVTKKEWVLDGDTVTYGSALDLKETLEYDLSVEREFSYKGLDIDEVIKHLARFVSNLWQIHVFKEGNTRTTAVFFIKYLRTLGFEATNDIFAENAWYFRNALVRANYSNLQKGIHETTEYVEIFLRNLLLDENNELHNREMHISGRYTFKRKPNIGGEKPNIGDEKPNIECEKPNIEGEKPNIEGEKPNIGGEKPNIGDEKPNIGDKNEIIEIINQIASISTYSRNQIYDLYKELGDKNYFGRRDVEKVLNLKSYRAHEIIKLMQNINIISPVKGHGKGKYRFNLQNE